MLEAARVEGISGRQLQALNSLLADPIVIGKNDGKPAVTEVLVVAGAEFGTVIGSSRADPR